VKGRVFLDFNANGIPDRGEPGVRDIDVVSDAGRSAVSGRNGQFVIARPGPTRRMRVSLKPESLPAIYTPTQGVQDAVLEPGLFTQVNLGVAALGSISGNLSAPRPEGALEGIQGVSVLLVDSRNQTVGRSVTSRQGDYYLGEVRPGAYTVMLDKTTIPPGYKIEVIAREVEVLSGREPFEVEDLSFLGEFTGPPEERPRETPGAVRYKVFE
jgi:hypothetical protein